MTPAYRASNVRLIRDPRTGRWAYTRPMPLAIVGAPAPAPANPAADVAPTESFSLADISKAFTHAITPSLILVGAATGAATALGWILMTRYVFKERGR